MTIDVEGTHEIMNMPVVYLMLCMNLIQPITLVENEGLYHFETVIYLLQSQNN